MCGKPTVPFVYPLECPSAIAGVWDPAQECFVMLNMDDIRYIIDTVTEIKQLLEKRRI